MRRYSASVDLCSLSDHLPVYAAFKIDLRRGKRVSTARQHCGDVRNNSAQEDSRSSRPSDVPATSSSRPRTWSEQDTAAKVTVWPQDILLHEDWEEFALYMNVGQLRRKSHFAKFYTKAKSTKWSWGLQRVKVSFGLWVAWFRASKARRMSFLALSAGFLGFILATDSFSSHSAIHKLLTNFGNGTLDASARGN